MRIRTIFIPAVISVLFLCVGCLYIPYLHHAVIHREPDEKTLSSIKEGVTSKEDILMMLGEPDRVMENEKFFQYWWQEESGTVVALSPKGGGVDPVRFTYSLHIYFDENNIVRKSEIKKKWAYNWYRTYADKFLFELYAGNYVEMEVPSTTEIELKKNGKGVWKTLSTETSFEWSIGHNQVKLEVESGHFPSSSFLRCVQVIGQIEDDILEILQPEDLKGRHFKRVRNSENR